jgi:two-component system, OmpR family, alkaline phosphatase synthesis response regulator PhoP
MGDAKEPYLMYDMVLLIEDNLALSKILTRDLTAASFKVQTLTMNQALAKVTQQFFPMLIVDLDNSHTQWEQLLISLSQQKQRSHIMVLTANPMANLEALKDLTLSYQVLKKPISNKALIDRLMLLLSPSKQEKVLAKTRHTFANMELDDSRQTVKLDNEDIFLTKVEYQLLKFMIANKEKPVSRDVILNAIWGFDYDGTTRIVDVHIYHLKTKLEKAKLTFKSIRSVGYSLWLD